MALISNFNLTCAGCKKPFPAHDDVCPHCGHTTPPGARRNKLRKGCLIGCPAIMLGLLVLLAIVGSFLPPPGDEERPATEQPPPKVAAARPPTSPPPAKVERSAIQRQTMIMWRAMTTLIRPCDQAMANIDAVLADASGGRATIVDAYRAAENGKLICLETSQNIGDLNIPEDAGDLEERFEEVRDECRGAYRARFGAFNTLGDALDGDLRPSTIAEYQDSMRDANIAQMSCLARFMALGGAVGLDTERMTAVVSQGSNN